MWSSGVSQTLDAKHLFESIEIENCISWEFEGKSYFISYGKKPTPKETFVLITHQNIQYDVLVKKTILSEVHFIRGFQIYDYEVRDIVATINTEDEDVFEKRILKYILTPMINSIRILHEKKRVQWMQRHLPTTVIKRYGQNLSHPFFEAFNTYLEDTFETRSDRYKGFIYVGASKTGKTFFFDRMLVPEKYRVIHKNLLSFNDVGGEQYKLFRILDDINWADVDSETLKALSTEE
ncbi:hypothetical protein EIN_150780 [Entamoeba invadens IP1]|uniref:Uncharacterized protein n=1 Tax=Entamoeba invadens IP1 TaxID=370355 RepID=A0A0A1UEF0_ENTIV|nr:hypothetical protein EIN_150780 [Entamoeba invadens IP1]ELP91201.1 hypothetical protein EIN_150780 [Entamoeba invadens IP1]|eukprot:XP_004257972.1 hypothetical protein EIN_150780 [Entamoeba invadens IP1]